MALSSGNTSSNASRRPPARIEMLPVAARWQPPETGQSTAWPPRPSTRAPSARTSWWSVVLISIQTLPGANWRKGAALALHDCPYGCRRGQAGNQGLDIGGHVRRRFRPARALVEEGLRQGAIEVPDGQIKAGAHQAAGEFGPDIAQTDKADFHRVSRRKSSGLTGAIIVPGTAAGRCAPRLGAPGAVFSLRRSRLECRHRSLNPPHALDALPAVPYFANLIPGATAGSDIFRPDRSPGAPGRPWDDLGPTDPGPAAVRGVAPLLSFRIMACTENPP